MKKPFVLVGVLVVLAVSAAIFFARKPTPVPALAPDKPKTGSLPSANPPVASSAPVATVAIQDGKTLDFSTGKPVLKDSAEEKAIIEQSVKEMNEAAASVTFGPRPTAPAADTKKPAPPQ